MMRPRQAALRIAVLMAVFLPLVQAGASTTPYKVLLFTRVVDGTYRHDYTRDPDGTGPKMSPIVQALKDLGAANNFTVDASEDRGVLTDANLAQYKAVVFATGEGDVLDAASEGAFRRYVEAGGGFVGLHSASFTEPTWSWYYDLVGARFANHPPGISTATVKVADRAHPSTASLPQRWVRSDEWYNFDVNPRGKVHVLATLDETTYSGGTMGADHPISWCKRFGKARSWYTGLGHTVESYTESLFLNHVLGGIQWAAGVASGDCGASMDINFDRVVLDDDINQPMSLAVLPDKRVLYLERAGKVKIHRPGASTVVAATLPVAFVYDLGLQGVAIDPNFASNGWVYLFYTASSGTQDRLSRFTLTGDTLDMSSEKVILSYTVIRHCCHQGGTVTFDPAGNLLLSTGDDTTAFESDGYAPIDERTGHAYNDAQKSSANRNDLRGKILRIKPLATPGPDCAAGQVGLGCTYSIPSGNLFPADGSQGRPEVYAMGLRNPFRMSVDSETGWIYVGDVGPDAWNDDSSRGPKGYDEINQLRSPANLGWPYCIANNKPYRDFDFLAKLPKLPFDCAAPVNDSPNNTGAQALPPAQGAWIWYPYAKSPEFPEVSEGYRTAQAGPVYHYDPANPNENKLPAYFDDTLFVYDWVRGSLWEVKLDGAGNVFKINTVLKGLKAPIDMEIGPDGAIYMLEWGSSLAYEGVDTPEADLIRIEYVDGRHVPVAKADKSSSTSGPAPLTVNFSSEGSHDIDQGDSITYSWDFGDGTGSSEPNPVHSYADGEFMAKLTVTDTTGRSASTSLKVISGNNLPVVVIEAPQAGRFHEFGDQFPYRVSVSDIEDGSTQDGGIDCSKVSVSVSLLHDTHSHPLNTTYGCEGTVVTQKSSSHNGDDRLASVITASYADKGTATVGSVTGSRSISLLPTRVQAEHYSQESGTKIHSANDRAGRFAVGSTEDGDWISFKDVSLTGISAIGYRVASSNLGGRMELRLDSPFGTKISEAQIPPTGSSTNWTTVMAPVQDPGGSHDLFLVFIRPSPVATCINGNTCNQYLDKTMPLFSLNWIDFFLGRSTDTQKLTT